AAAVAGPPPALHPSPPRSVPPVIHSPGGGCINRRSGRERRGPMRRIIVPAAVLFLAAWNGSGDQQGDDDGQCAWEQWGQSGAHEGATCVAGQAPTTTLA